MSQKNSNIANLDSDFLSKLVEEMVADSVKGTFSHLIVENEEKNNQEKTAKEIEKLDLRAEKDDPGKSDEEESKEEENKEETSDDTTKIKAQKLPDSMEAEDVSRMLNIIRAGKSLKDKEVKERFDVWFGSLTPSEKSALKAFLDGIAEIITGNVEAEEASKPSQSPYNVKMTSASKPSPRNVDKEDLPAEDSDDSDAPIVVGEVSDTTKIKKRYFNLKS